MTIGIGFSKDEDPKAAAQRAVAAAQKSLGEGRTDLVLVLATAHYDPKDLLPALYTAVDRIRIVGTSTAGIILPDRVEARGVAVVLLRSDALKCETGFIEHLDLQDMRTAGRNLINTTMGTYGRSERRALLVFTDGLLSGISTFIAGIKDSLGYAFPVFGACGCDHFHFRHAWQFFDDRGISRGAVLVLVGGRASLAAACRHGWKPLGRPRKVDVVRGPKLLTIDGAPALRLYERYFPELTPGGAFEKARDVFNRYPLGFKTPDQNDYLLRNVIGLLDEGGLLCQDDVPEGAAVHLMIGGKEAVLQSAAEAAEDVVRQLQNPPRLSLVFSSLRRFRILGRNAAEEISIVHEKLGKGPLIGAYVNGEIFSPPTLSPNAPPFLHNGSITVIGMR